MSIETRHDAQDPPAALDPFRIGYRYVPAVGPDGHERPVMVPLTEEDFLHPQEEDRQMLTDLHTETVNYLRDAIRIANDGRAGFRVFSDHRIDWQVPGVLPHGPDVVAFENFFADWDPLRGTLPVRDLGLEVLVVIEVTSEATRATDFEPKFLEFFDAGIPYYVILDAAGPEGYEKVLGYGRGDDGFEPLPRDDRLGVLVPDVNIWLRWAGDRFVAATEAGAYIPTNLELARDAERERQRADVETLRAAAEKLRADEATQRLEDLQRELAALKARRNGSH